MKHHKIKSYRLIEFSTAVLLLFITFSLLLLSWIIAIIDTKTSGVFIQERIGKKGNPFRLYKLRTIHPKSSQISFFGRFLRKTKLDELPQLFNVLNGTMSFVGPRPDLAYYADLLQGEDRQILQLRPGITGLASLKYRNEEMILAQQLHPKVYNDTVIWPDKVRINKWYLANRSFSLDLKIIFYTILPLPFNVDEFVATSRR